MLLNEDRFRFGKFLELKISSKEFFFNGLFSNRQNMTIKLFDNGWRILRFILNGDRIFEISAESI